LPGAADILLLHGLGVKLVVVCGGHQQVLHGTSLVTCWVFGGASIRDSHLGAVV
jgi:hypothetical protein